MSRTSVAALAAALSTTLTPAVAAAGPAVPTGPTGPSLAAQMKIHGQRQAARTRRAIVRRHLARAQAAAAPSSDPRLAAIRACESGGDYTTNTGNGFYGAYQFTLGTWQSVGGSGLPSAASPAEQDRRALMLIERSGSSPWPVCG